MCVICVCVIRRCVAESEARGRGVDGRVCRVYVPAAAGVPAPVRRRRVCAEGAEEPAELQELQVVHDGGGLGSAQTLSSGGASGRRVGRGVC